MGRTESKNTLIAKSEMLEVLTDNPWITPLELKYKCRLTGKQAIAARLTSMLKNGEVKRRQNPHGSGTKNRYLYAVSACELEPIECSENKATNALPAQRPLIEDKPQEALQPTLKRPQTKTAGLGAVLQVAQETNDLIQLIRKLRHQLRTLIDIED